MVGKVKSDGEDGDCDGAAAVAFEPAVNGLCMRGVSFARSSNVIMRDSATSAELELGEDEGDVDGRAGVTWSDEEED